MDCDSTTSNDKDENGTSTSEASVKQVEVDKKSIEECLEEVEKAPLKLDDKWYILSLQWWKKLTNAVKQGYVEDIPPINNSSISEYRSGQYFLLSNLVERMDFIAAPEAVFLKFSKMFGVEDERRDIIERRVILSPIKKSLVIDYYPRVAKVCLASDRKKCCELQLRNDTLGELRSRALKQLQVKDGDVKNIRIYIIHPNEKLELLDVSDPDAHVEGVLSADPTVIIDVQDDLGNFFIGGASASVNRPIDPAAVPVSIYTRGVCGLQNLGNTCFMSSAVQCLSNIPPITEYFLSDRYLQDLNYCNPLGTQGQLAQAYSSLMHNMWSGRHSSFNPRILKTTIGKFAPRFSGYSQQDSQELLAFLLDGLHEDLNRIKEKPYVEEAEADDTLPEREVADRAWQTYLKRNDSIIVDKVHGQIKSTLVCPSCNKVSIKFDPFCFLSVPVPIIEKVTRQLITIMFNPTKKWAKFAVSTDRQTTVKEAEGVIKKHLRADIDFILLTVDGDQVDLFTEPSDSVMTSDNKSRIIYGAELAKIPAEQRLLVTVRPYSCITKKYLTLPMVFAVKRDITEDDLSRYVDDAIVPFFHETYKSRDPTISLPAPGSVTYTLSEPFPLQSSSIRIQLMWPEEQDPLSDYRGLDLVEREITAPVQKKDTTLEDCLNLFTKEEELSKEDTWYCPTCKEHKRATKKLDLWRLPEILIVHLKRFCFTRWSREKINTNVIIPRNNFQLTSVLANENHDEAVYDLIAVSHHMGSLGGGHYTASALNGDKWYDFNDNSVRECAPPCEPSSGISPYMLFYRRREPPSPAHSDANIEMETDD